jgi:hypothetical protein
MRLKTFLTEWIKYLIHLLTCLELADNQHSWFFCPGCSSGTLRAHWCKTFVILASAIGVIQAPLLLVDWYIYIASMFVAYPQNHEYLMKNTEH